MNDPLPPLAPAAADTSLAAPSSPSPEAAPETDAHGHDLSLYDWVPVLRKRRSDGWTPGVQRRFIEVLADSGSVMHAARAVDKSESSCYQLRRAPGAESFAAAWAAAIDEASKRLLDAAFERALVGTDEPVFDRDGNRTGRRLRQSDRLMMFLLRAYMPDRFGGAGPDARPSHSSLPALAPVAAAIERLMPAPPADPHLLMDEDRLGMAIKIADYNDGELQMRHRDPAPMGINNKVPVDEKAERLLEDSKRMNAGERAMTDHEWANHLHILKG
jgi:hypothetical protein